MKKIIVFDKDGLAALAIKFRLEKMGYKVYASFYSGDNAAKKALKTKPNLILMNYELREQVSGMETANRIRFQIDVPIIFYTYYTIDKILEGFVIIN